MVLPVVRSVAVVIDGDPAIVDVSAFGAVIVVSPVVLPVTTILTIMITPLDFTDSGICVEVVVVTDEY